MEGSPELVIFDLDGTLIDTAPEIVAATNEFLEFHGWARLEAERITGWIGHGTRELLSAAVAHCTGRTAEAIRRGENFSGYVEAFDVFYEAHCGTTSRLYPYARETLRALQAAGILLGMVTNKEARHTRRVLAAHGIDQILGCVISGDTLSTRKPDPAGVHACIAEFGARRDRTLFVGDSSVDAETGRNAGIPVWLLSHGYAVEKPMDESRETPTFDDLPDILRALLPGELEPMPNRGR